MNEQKIQEAIELLEHRIAVSKVSADNDNYLIQLSIKEASGILALLKEPAEKPDHIPDIREKVGIFTKECREFMAFPYDLDAVGLGLRDRLISACARLKVFEKLIAELEVAE